MAEKQQPCIRLSEPSCNQEKDVKEFFSDCVFLIVAQLSERRRLIVEIIRQGRRSRHSPKDFFENTIKTNFFSFLFLAIKSCTFGNIECLNEGHFSSSLQLWQKKANKKTQVTLHNWKDEKLRCNTQIQTNLETPGLQFCFYPELIHSHRALHYSSCCCLYFYILTSLKKTCLTLPTKTPMPVV